MALHTELDIYRDACELFAAIANAVANMRKDFKPLIGQELLRESTRITIYIFRANVATDKGPHLMKVVESQQMIELLSRFARDQKLMVNPAYAAIVELTTKIGKKANGWRKSNAARLSHGGHGHHD
jgi:hypothetical protein